ncbi:hypothetical protein JVU11DRAFT_4084 [Chiua virens]|nr:hypothetical protein JVU11DRAFT_4084 [Chiua virens]
MNSSQTSFTTVPPNASQSSIASGSGTPSAFSLGPGFSFPALSQETTGSGGSTSSTLADPNSPELFKQHIQIAMEHVARVNAFARSALINVQQAYQTGVNPAQTQADLLALDQALHTLADILRQSGVGAYPLPPSQTQGDSTISAGPPTEQQLIAGTTRGVQQLYDEFKRMQESSAVVANLLGATETLSGSARPKV